MKTKYVIVQHSGAGYAGKPGWEQGLEVRSIDTAAVEKKVRKAGGLVFDDWGKADDFCDRESHPDGAGIYPRAPGKFSDVEVDGLRVYVPFENLVTP